MKNKILLKSLAGLCALAAVACGGGPGPQGSVAVYLDESQPIEKRVEDALSRMTLEEKVAILHAQSKFSSAGVPRLGIPEVWCTDGPHGIRPNKAVNQILGWIVNIGRSIPFIILMVAIMPFTKLVVGTKIGVRGAIVPLVVSAAPFIARMVETSLAEVDAGVVEAAQSMGASTFQIIWKVYLPEAKPSLVLGGAISIVTILGYTAIAGTVGAGGLGDIAVRYGHQRFITSVMWVTVVILIVMVQVVQSLFNWLSKKIDKRLDTGTKKQGTFDLLSRLAHTK